MSDNRDAQRQRILKGGKIVFNDGRSTIDCTVRNLSAGGARLRVPSVIGIPDAFELRISETTTHQCTIAWRKPDELGVKFV